MSSELLNNISDTTSINKMKAQLDGLDVVNKMDTAYPSSMSILDSSGAMYKRQTKKKMDRRGRFRTQPVTFTEIKEVDEEMTEDTLARSEPQEQPSQNIVEKRKSAQLYRSHSCRKPETITRFDWYLSWSWTFSFDVLDEDCREVRARKRMSWRQMMRLSHWILWMKI